MLTAPNTKPNKQGDRTKTSRPEKGKEQTHADADAEAMNNHENIGRAGGSGGGKAGPSTSAPGPTTPVSSSS